MEAVLYVVLNVTSRIKDYAFQSQGKGADLVLLVGAIPLARNIMTMTLGNLARLS